MVDTVWLTTGNFGVAANNRLETLEHVRRSGEVVEKKYCNLGDKDLADTLAGAGLPAQGNVTVHGLYGGGPLLLFNVSLPKLLHGHSLAEVGPADLDRCIDGIHRQIAFAGIDIDRQQIPEMNVARIDLCRNIEIDGGMSEYLYMIDKCTLPHAEKMPQPQGTVLFRNASWQFTSYDKVGEVVSNTKQRIAAGLTKDTRHNVLRFEYRIIRGVNVRRLLKRHTFAECFDRDLTRQKLLGKFDRLQLDVAAKAMIDSSTLAHLFANYGHDTVKDSIAMPAILAGVGYDLDLLADYLRQRYSEKQVRNIRNEYKALLYKKNVPAHRDLWQEMRSKLAA